MLFVVVGVGGLAFMVERGCDVCIQDSIIRPKKKNVSAIMMELGAGWGVFLAR